VLLAEVSGFDLDGRRVLLNGVDGIPAPASLPYDTLIVAGGSRYSYFGHDDWRSTAAEVKSLESALVVRSRLLSAFEAAEAESDLEERGVWLTFVVVGGGPTGVEMAGQIAELARDTLHKEFRAADPRSARILLVEAADRVLTTFPPPLSAKAALSLERIGVTVLTGRAVVGIDEEGVMIGGDGVEPERIATRNVVWAAGVTASSLAARLAELTGAELDHAGRVTVEADLTLPGRPEVFAVGDMVRLHDTVFPGVAPVAMQQGRYVAEVVRDRLRSREKGPFHYRDKGNLATIGRASAVADIKGLKLSGFLAWVTWLVVHLWYLVGFQNRLVVIVRWSFSFVTHGRGSRLITNLPGQVRERQGLADRRT
jgi:NADH dehydrogenase